MPTVDVRIGVTYTSKEIDVELGDGADATKIKADIEAALASESGVLWLTDKTGRQEGVPVPKVAYVEVVAAGGERQIGFSGVYTHRMPVALLDRRLLFVTGKGGVGKTTVAAE